MGTRGVGSRVCKLLQLEWSEVESGECRVTMQKAWDRGFGWASLEDFYVVCLMQREREEKEREITAEKGN